MQRCLVVEHAEPEKPYAIACALEHCGVEIEVCRTFLDEQLPHDLREFDALVIMGGPMSATSSEGFFTRDFEIGLLSEAIDRQLPALGICLGAQLMALAAGASVHRGDAGPEIGWAAIRLTAEAATDPLFAGLPQELEVLHWHSDTFDLPIGASLLASSNSYQNQAFRVGACAWGVQFHLEVDEDAVRAFVRAFGDEARELGADPGSIVERAPSVLGKLSAPSRLVADRFAALVVGNR